MTYQVIGNTRTRTLRVLWMLQELGEPYEHIKADVRSPEVRALNPSGKVPVLLVDGTPVTDSTAILTYLADHHGKLTFPAGTLERARQDGLTHMVLDEMDAVLWTAARHSFVLPEEHRMPEIKGPLRWEFGQTCARLSERLGDGPFLMGQTMTIADILLAHCLNWAINAKFPVEQKPLLDYLARMKARPGFVAASES